MKDITLYIIEKLVIDDEILKYFNFNEIFKK